MEIKFKNEIQYLVDLNNYLLKDSKAFKFKKIFFTWLPLIVIILTNPSWRKNSLLTNIIVLSIGLISVLISSILIKWLSARSIRSYLKGHSGSDEYINSYTTILLTPNELIQKGTYSESRIYWNSIIRLVVEDKYIYIYTKSINCLQIPLVSFESSKEKDDFISYVNKKINI